MLKTDHKHIFAKASFDKIIVAILIFTAVLGSTNSFAIQPQTSVNDTQPKPEVAIKKITKADFIALVMDFQQNPKEWVYKGKKPCIIDFYADWCGPCKIASPILEELAQEYKGKINVYKVDVDNEKELSSIFGVSGIPAFLYCPMEGQPSMASGIGRDKEQTKQMFRTNIETMLLKTK